MDDLGLPQFDIPKLRPKRVTFKVYDAWVHEMWRNLRENGYHSRLRDRPDRRPADARFEL